MGVPVDCRLQRWGMLPSAYHWVPNIDYYAWYTIRVLNKYFSSDWLNEGSERLLELYPRTDVVWGGGHTVNCHIVASMQGGSASSSFIFPFPTSSSKHGGCLLGTTQRQKPWRSWCWFHEAPNLGTSHLLSHLNVVLWFRPSIVQTKKKPREEVMKQKKLVIIL